MNVSKELQSQMTRLQKTGAFGLSYPQKQELQRVCKELGLNPLENLECGTCLRNAMWNLINFQVQSSTRPKLQFKGVKDPSKLSYKELRETVKAKGLLRQHMTKEEMIKALK